jgi:hypothetical protein
MRSDGAVESFCLSFFTGKANRPEGVGIVGASTDDPFPPAANGGLMATRCQTHAYHLTH